MEASMHLTVLAEKVSFVCLVILTQAIFFPLATFAKAGYLYQHPNGAVETFDGKQVAVIPLFHGTLMFQFESYTVYVDPVSPEKFDGFPKANLILITHQHGDHLNAETIAKLSSDSTVVIANGKSAERPPSAKVMANGDKMTVGPLAI